MKNWKTISSKVDWQCPYFKIVRQDFVSSRGKKSSYFILKQNDGVIVIVKDGECVYMEELYRFFVKKKSLEFPGGEVEKNEKPSQAAKREIKEELGMIAKKITFLSWYYVWIARTDMKVYIFLAEDISFDKKKKKLDKEEKKELLKVRKIKISNIPKLIKSGKIKSTHHVLAYYTYLNFHREQNKK